VSLKPYYEHAGIKIFHGDCREILPVVAAEGAAIVSDPPYGIGFDTDYTRFTQKGSSLTGGARFSKEHAPIAGDDAPFDPTWLLGYGKVVLWGANCYSAKLPTGTWLVWDKRHREGTAFLSDAEVAWMNSGHGVYIYQQVWQGLVRSEMPVLHPNQKPTALMEWCIRKTNSSGVICDPYMGSGTTLVAAKNIGRKAIGIEIEERYCEIAAKRLSQEVFDFSPSATTQVAEPAEMRCPLHRFSAVCEHGRCKECELGGVCFECNREGGQG
jgi:DNA modification methylase